MPCFALNRVMYMYMYILLCGYTISILQMHAAPQYEHDVVTVPSHVVDGSSQLCVAHFRQPYSTAYIRYVLSICGLMFVAMVKFGLALNL